MNENTKAVLIELLKTVRAMKSEIGTVSLAIIATSKLDTILEVVRNILAAI